MARKAETTGVRLGKGAAGTGSKQGIWKHQYLNKLLKRYQKTTNCKLELVPEQAFLNKFPVTGRPLGCSVPDVYNNLTQEIFDYKFLQNFKAFMSKAQSTKNAKNVPLNSPQSQHVVTP
jgi:hypothetical protein